MNRLIHILHLEDDATDAELIQATLESAGIVCQINRVQNRDEFTQALQQGEYDLILADYRLPAYDGVSALRLAQELRPDLPFIFVSGTLGEDAVIIGLTQGATDYVLKQKLSRLAPAVERALREAENQRMRQRAEAALQAHVQHSQSLLRLSKQLERAQTYGEILNAALAEVRTIIGYQNLWVYLLTEDRQHVKALTAGGHMSESVMTGEGIATLTIRGDRMLEEIIAATHLVLVEDALLDERTDKAIVARLGNRTIVNVPIILLDKHLGAVGTGTFGDEGVRVPTPSEQEYLMAMASHMAVSLDRLRLFEQHQQAEGALRRLNRELRAISDCNQTLLRAVDEQTLLNDICRIVCDEAGYRMAWVGYARNDDARMVQPVAWAGSEDGYLEQERSTWADTEHGCDPTCTAIQRGESVCIQDFTTDSPSASWRESALQRDYRSSIALPLKDESAHTFGALTIYSTDPNAFTPDEMRLLEELAGDLAFGITTLRTRAERKRAEEALWESSQMLQLVLDNIPAYVFWKDRNSVYLGCNYLSAINSGLSSPQEIIGLTDFDLPWEDTQAESYRADDRLVMETGLPKLNYEEMQLTADGRVITLCTSKVPLWNPAGDVIGVLGTFEDITERKRAEEALRESQALYRSFIEQLPNPVFRKDSEGRYVMVNSKFCQIKGVKAEDFLGRKPTEVASSELAKQGESGQAVKYAAQGEEVHELIMRTGQVVTVEEEHLGADGGRQCMHVIRMPVFDAEGKIVGTQGIQFDITERKRAEEEIYTLNQQLEQRVIDRTAELARAHEHLRAILDTAGEGVVFTDLLGTIEYINPAMERLTGYQATEAIGRNPRLWKSNQTPAATHRQMWRALTGGEIWQGELINRRKDGTLYDAALTTAPLTNPEGQIVGFVGVQRDISRQKELDRLKDQFVSNVSHELRTPLANILLHIGLLEHGKPDRLVSYQQTLRREAERLRKLIEDLLDLSRLDRNVASIQLAPIDLNQLLEHLVTDRAALAEQRGLTLTYEPAPGLPLVLADAPKLIQVASNLLTNALNYTAAGGVISVWAEERHHEGQKMAAFTVRDTGPGITAQDMPHLFERFYRGTAGRRASASGTGLGLAISHEIMERLGGRITFESEAGRGAAFTVWLPLT